MEYICKWCKNHFQAPPSQKARFCNRLCYDKSREGIFKCNNCGISFKYYKSHKKGKLIFCTQKCQLSYMVGDRHPHWTGAGYRKIIENKIGRKLNPSEIIHHINGNHHDNRIENLMITTRAEHAELHRQNSPFVKGHKPFPRPAYGGK